MFFACTARYFGACLHVRQNICEASSHVVEKFLQLEGSCSDILVDEERKSLFK
jgi:hypothetical protein